MNENRSERGLKRPASANDAPSPEVQSAPEFTGHVDGVDSEGVFGWAWRASTPDERVTVEQWVEGVLAQTTCADIFRNDLQAAGIGDGAHGWRLPLAIEGRGLHRVEFRVGDVVLSGGTVHVLVDKPLPPPVDPAAIAGHCDGVDGAIVQGWAWRPSTPDERIVIEQWVDGALKATAVADLDRADLAENGVGDGAHAWRMRLALDPSKTGPQHVELRVVERHTLPGGALDVTFDPAAFAESDAVSVAAYLDRREGDELIGWAWRPRFPEQHVEIEQWVDGKLVDTVIADLTRADLTSSNVGHGRYGWRMRLKLDPARTVAQVVEIRTKGGPVVEDGRLEFVYEADGAAAQRDAASAESAVFGSYDGLKGAALHGWAWNPRQPNEHVEVELWIDGVHVSDAVCDGFRPDLRSNGIGHGRYGWRFPIKMEAGRTTPLQIEVRAKGGGPLSNGVFELKNDLALDDPANAELRSFVASVLNLSRMDRAPRVEGKGATFLVYCPPQRESGRFWAQEYEDYAGAARAFSAVLAQYGEVVRVLSSQHADLIYDEHTTSGGSCVLLSFTPPRLAPLNARCPIVPVFAWSFPTLPSGTWDGDPRSDWRFVLRQTGRAIVFSEFAAEAVRASMSEDFPVVALAPPVFDRAPKVEAPNAAMRKVTIDGVVFDSRDHDFDPNNSGVPLPVWHAEEAGKRILDIEGVLFSSCLDLHDGRSNWEDLVSAFVTAHGKKSDAVLLLKLTEPMAEWWREIFKWLNRLPAFACRIVAVRGDLDAEDERSLIAATHWYVNAAKAAGLCLPLQTFLSAGRPAVTPAHTAMTDLADVSNALLVASEEEPWSWPDHTANEGWSWTQHPDDVAPTTRHRVQWASLVAQLDEAYRISTTDLEKYRALSAGAVQSMSALCSDGVIGAALDRFLALDGDESAKAPAPSKLMSEPTPA